MDIDLTRLQHIAAVARLRSFSRAAEDLHITQPALSRSIASFEQRHGVRLFDRGRSGAVPTAIGALVVAQAEQLMRSAHDLGHNLRLYRTGEAGDLAIGFGPLIASLLLPEISRHLLATRPHLKVHAVIKPAEQMLAELLADKVEMVFGNSWLAGQSNEVAVEPLGTLRLVWVARSDHPLAGKAAISIAQLDDFPVASITELPAAGVTGRSGAFVCENYPILRDAVLGSDCVCLSAEPLTADDVAAGRLAILDVRDSPVVLSDISVVRRRERLPSPGAAAVVALVRERLASTANR